MTTTSEQARIAVQDRGLALLEILTVGLPFCAFKVLFGGFLVRIGGALAIGVGTVLAVLGAIDAVLNTINLASWLARRRRAAPICSLSWLVHRARPGAPETRADALGTALDVLLAFALVAAAVGGGLLPRFDPTALSIWNVAVVVNVLGAGVLRVAAALRAR